MQRNGYAQVMAYVDTSAGPGACHPWGGAKSGGGYGKVRVGGVQHQAHRWLLGHLRGRPLGHTELALHYCDNPSCCNPAHLYVGDHTQNMRDKADRGRAWSVMADLRKAQTHCVNGHEFDEANTYIRRDGYRSCRSCTALQQRSYQARRREAVAA